MPLQAKEQQILPVATEEFTLMEKKEQGQGFYFKHTVQAYIHQHCSFVHIDADASIRVMVTVSELLIKVEENITDGL